MLIDKQDLTALYSAIQKYNLQSKQELYNAFKFLGVGFDSNGSTRLGNMGSRQPLGTVSVYFTGASYVLLADIDKLAVLLSVSVVVV